MAVHDLWMHRRAFDTLAEKLKQSVALAAQLPASRDSTAPSVFDLALERYADLFRRPSFAHLPLSHLVDTAIHTEALLAYECEAEARRLALAGRPARPAALQHAQRHTERLDALLNGVLRGHGLASSSHRPYVMPSRGVFVAPVPPALEASIRRECNYYRNWHGGVVTVLEDRRLDTWRVEATQLAILFLDADELLGEDLRRQSDPALAAHGIDIEFARRLHYAQQVSADGVGEDFDAYYVRLLLKQNVLLRSLLPRLLADNQHAAHRHFAPLLEENTMQLQAELVRSPRRTDEHAPRTTAVLGALETLERDIGAHAAAWTEHGRAADSAGLLFQFEGVLGTSLAEPVKAMQDAHP